MSFDFDVLIVGAGPGGYVAAIRAAQLGMKTALVEGRDDGALGGTCLNVGCIPSKALLNSSEKFEAAEHHLADHGIEVGKVKLDLKKMIGRKDEVVKQLTGGIGMLMKKNKVTVINGWAKVTGDNEVTVGKDKHTAKNIIIAAGSTVVELPFAKFDGKTIISSTEALDLKKVPEHLIVIGAGVIGLEMGSVWRRLGAKVTLVDIADVPVAIMDKDLAKEALKTFKKQGLDFKLSSKVTDVKKTKSGVTVTIEGKDGKAEELKGDKLLVSVGRKPATEGLVAEGINVEINDRGQIETNDHFQTATPSIYAIGDCRPGPMLAHKSEEEGVACAEHLAGQSTHIDYNMVPWVVYTSPELAGVGITEQDAKEKGIDYTVGKFSFRANGRALAIDEGHGFVKIIAQKGTDKLLGVHIIGHNASEMIAEAVSVMEFGGSAEDIARTVHAHPTMSEAVKEAALDVHKRAIHS